LIYLKTIRLKQWLKNILIFVAVFGANEINFSNIKILVQVFVGFSLIVSSTYIYNDFKDIEADRQHPEKNKRPIASGKVSRKTGNILMTTLFILGKFILLFTNPLLLFFSSLYVLTTTLYSTKLKFIKYFDIVSVSLLFILRIFLGAYAVSVPLSLSLIMFVFFTSLGLAAGKKLSIFLNDAVGESKVKAFLKSSYEKQELLNIVQITSLFSFITYSYWIFIIKYSNKVNIGTVFLILSCIFLGRFQLLFIKKTKEGLTEEIIEATINNYDFLIVTLLFGSTAVVGLLL
jgi:4-hydroxybenzoate polyprenyltransferase